LRFLGITLRVLRLEVSVYNVYITNQFQTTFAPRGEGSKIIIFPITSTNLASTMFNTHIINIGDQNEHIEIDRKREGDYVSSELSPCSSRGCPR
jgi:hypothetical protein